MVSVRKLLFGVFVGILLLLGCVGGIGFLQFRLTDSYNNVIEQGGRVLFQFNMVRERITQAMLEKKWHTLDTSVEGIEAINIALTALLDNNLIPKEYKVVLINQVDLPSVILLSNRLVNKPEKEAHALELNDKLRLMSDQLVRLERVLVAEMKAQLVRFQNIAISVLTIIVATLSLMLLILYQKGFFPLIRLTRQIQELDDLIPLESDKGACKEIKKLITELNRMVLLRNTITANDEKGGLTPEHINTISNQLNGIINYTQLLIDEGQQDSADAKNVTILEKILSSGEIMTAILQDKHSKDKI